MVFSNNHACLGKINIDRQRCYKKLAAITRVKVFNMFISEYRSHIKQVFVISSELGFRE